MQGYCVCEGGGKGGTDGGPAGAQEDNLMNERSSFTLLSNSVDTLHS